MSLRCGNFGLNGVFILIWESSENQFGRPKKSRQDFGKSAPMSSRKS